MLWCDVITIADSGGESTCVDGGRRWGVHGMSETDGRLHRAWMVTDNRHSECILKASDEEADLVLFTGDADV